MPKKQSHFSLLSDVFQPVLVIGSDKPSKIGCDNQQLDVKQDEAQREEKEKL